MNTRFTEMTKSLHSRWKPEWSKEVPLMHVTKAFSSSLTSVEALISKAAEMRVGGKFSNQGLTEEIRGAAKTDTVPVLKKAADAIAAARRDLKTRRAALTVPKPDPANTADAIVRSEMRTWLRGLPQTQAAQVLLGEGVDERMLQAAFEAPPVMSGLTEDQLAKVQHSIIERRFGVEIEKLNELEEAVTVANSALEIAVYQLRQEAGFANEDLMFDKWMAEATAAADAVEVAKPQEVVLAENADWIDEIFAKGFPSIYPDHPANKRLA